MTFDEMTLQLKAGMRMRRRNWNPGEHIRAVPETDPKSKHRRRIEQVYPDHVLKYYPNYFEQKATDWEVVP